MKNHPVCKKKKKPSYSIVPITSCKGKKGGCYWEGEPELITRHKIAA